METYRTWLRLFELLRYYSWIVDRFHISTQAYQLQEVGRQYDFSWLEERLVPTSRVAAPCREPHAGKPVNHQERHTP